MKISRRKRHVKVIYRLLTPMLILAVSGIIVAITGMNSLTTSSKSMEKISGPGVQCIITLDQIAYDVEQTQKITLLYIADPTDTYMTNHALQTLSEISERMESNHEILVENADNFSEEDRDKIEQVYNLIGQSQKKVLELIRLSHIDKDVAGKNAAETMELWSNSITGVIDELIVTNNANIEDRTAKQKASVYTLTMRAVSMIIFLVIVSVISIIIVIRAVAKPLNIQKKELYEIIEGINEGKGDLSKRLRIINEDEIGDCSRVINKFIETLQNIIGNITVNANSLEDIVGKVSHNVALSKDNANDISAIMEELAATMEEVASTTNTVTDGTESTKKNVEGINEQMRELSQYSKEMRERADELERVATDNRKNTNSMVESITAEMNEALEQSKSVEKVSQLTAEILSISSQTNLLALNASIEAARAGDAGKGFAVVADEIRQLADSSRDTATNIQNINEMVINAVKALVDSSTKIVSFINENVLPDYESFVEGGKQYSDDAKMIHHKMKQCSAGAEEATKNMTDISSSMEGINQIVEDSTHGVTNAASNVDALVNAITTINEQMNENISIANNFKNETRNFIASNVSGEIINK